eukprot:PITA_06383
MGIEMDDNGKYSVSRVGTVAFQREHGVFITLKNVKYVPGLKKNLVSVTMLEEKGYNVVFSKGKVLLRHIAMGQTKRIGIRVKNLYKLEVDDCVALSMKVELVQSQDIGKLWHRIYFMQKKDQTFSNFCEFKDLVEKELGKKIKALRSNNGREYVSQKFKDFCAVEGIKQELTAPHNPWQNEVAERKNRTIVGVA